MFIYIQSNYQSLIFLNLEKSLPGCPIIHHLKLVILLTLTKSLLKLVIYLTLSKSYKQHYQQNSLGGNRMPRHLFLRLLPCVTGTPPWLLRPMKASTSSELYLNTELFFECLGIQFFNSSHVTYRTLCRTRDHSHPPKEAEDFPGGGNHSKQIPPTTYLA